MIVRVENVFFVFAVPGDMNLPDAIVRDVVQIIVWIEAVVLAGDVDVVHIQQNAAVGPLDDFASGIPIRSFPKREIRHSC